MATDASKYAPRDPCWDFARIRCPRMHGIASNRSLDLLDAIKTRLFSQRFGSESASANSITIFNPSPWQRSNLAACEIDAEKVQSENFGICDPETGKSIPFQMIRRASGQNPDTPQLATVLFDAESLPGLALKKLSLKKSDQSESAGSTFNCSRFFLENDFLRVSLSHKMAVSRWTDKTKNQIYERLNIFEDSGDFGDTAAFAPPEANPLLLSKSFRPRISLVEKGPLRGSIRIRYRMKIPIRNSGSETRKKVKTEILRIWTHISLDCNAPGFCASRHALKTRLKIIG